MAKATQANLGEFSPETTTKTVTKTVKIPLATSNRKNERVDSVIEEWQAIAGRMNELMPSVGQDHWRTQDTTLYHLVQNEFPNHSLRAHDASQAAYKVGEAWGSWDSNGREGDTPEFGDGTHARLCHCGVTVEPNDSGYGVKLSLEPRDPEWFRCGGGPFQAEYLNRVTDGTASTGSCELHRHGDSLTAHLSVSADVEVCEWDDISTVVGVDRGERVMWAAAALGNDGRVKQVEMESGREYRHTRERLKRKKQRFGENGQLQKQQAARNQYYDYTDHITHVASREIVDIARNYSRVGIVLEDLTNYRSQKGDGAIHDWPFAELETKINYKATEAGIPVKTVDPKNTSISCRKCGHINPRSRDGTQFTCRRCGYTVHADVNAAMNIASIDGCVKPAESIRGVDS